MNKSQDDQRREEVSLQLEATNAQIHRLRLRTRELNEALTALKNGKPAPPKPAPPKKSTVNSET